MNIAVLNEGFGHSNSEADVDECVRAGATQFKSLGENVEDVSNPMALLGPSISPPMGVQGLVQTMLWGDGYGLNRPDLSVTSLVDFHRGGRQRANEFVETTKLFMRLDTYISEQHGSRYYGKAMNIRRRLTAAYYAVLASYDLLLMPTLPMKATPLPGPRARREEQIERAIEMITSTAVVDITHRPEMRIPCGLHDGPPEGMMLVANHFDGPSIY